MLRTARRTALGLLAALAAGYLVGLLRHRSGRSAAGPVPVPPVSGSREVVQP